MTEKENNLQWQYLGRTKIVLLCVALFLSIVGTVFMFTDARVYAIEMMGGEVVARHPVSGVMPLVGTLLLSAALFLAFFEETHPKFSVVTMILPILAGGVIFPSCAVTDFYEASTILPRLGYWMAVCGGIFALASCVLTAILLYKNRKKKGEGATVKREANYVLRLKEASEALTAIRDLYDRGILTDKEYEEEKAFVMHLYGIGKLARDGVSEGFLEKKAIPEEEIARTEEVITIISSSFDDDFDD